MHTCAGEDAFPAGSERGLSRAHLIGRLGALLAFSRGVVLRRWLGRTGRDVLHADSSDGGLLSATDESVVWNVDSNVNTALPQSAPWRRNSQLMAAVPLFSKAIQSTHILVVLYASNLSRSLVGAGLARTWKLSRCPALLHPSGPVSLQSATGAGELSGAFQLSQQWQLS